ncbi:NACHT domain-containing NTPase, partial [Nostoc sp. UCD120]|uniref:NACHT domain-containing protein n=1 Tax=Nostoc sp. UCD120 TaxID=2681312 RepID=UPI001623F638
MLSDEQRRRLEQEKNSFEQSYELQSEKIARLRNAFVIETNPLSKFQYEQQIKNEETELKRLTDRLDEIEKQLQSAQPTPVISESKATQTPQFQDEYYKRLIYLNEKSQTEGLSQIGNLSLSNVFVPLKIAVNYRENARSAIIPQEGDNTNLQEERTIWNFFNSEKRSIVLLGAAGSGKTTLLKHLTLVYASKQQEDWNEKAPELIPVLLLIKEVYKKIVAPINPPGLPYLIAEETKCIVKGNQTTQLSQWFSEKLDQGLCLIMLDGLDEVADESQHKQVTDWVDEQRKRYYKNFFILTSRPLASKDAYLKNADIFLEVQPFNLDQIPSFILRWYEGTEQITSGKSKEEINEQVKKQAENLINRIRNSSSLAAMAVNPLLLTMICTVYHKNRRLPEKTVDLYKVIYEVLLEKSQIKGVPYTVQDKQSVLQILALIAMKLMQNKDTKFELSKEESWIKEQLAKLESNDVTLEKFIKYICEIGLLVEHEEGYQFAHLSFQQYLA